MSNQADIRQKLRDRIEEMHQKSAGSIADILQFQLIDQPEGEQFSFVCETQPWMRNSLGTLHGGMGAAIVDQAMGYVSHCLTPAGELTPTIQMSLNYHRPLTAGRQVLVRVHLLNQTKSLIHLAAEAYSFSDPEKLCLSATGIYFFKPRKEKPTG